MIREEYNTYTQSHTYMAGGTFDTSEIPGYEDKLSRIDAATILYGEAQH